MKLSTMIRTCLTLFIAIFLGACDPDEPTGPPPQNSGSGDADMLLPLTFFHVQDSDGGRAGAGVDVVLVFEPNGIADLYTARATEAIAYKGNYSVKDGKITLKFNDPDLKADATFTIDTAQENVTMPFKAFSTTAGSSTWKLKRLAPEHNMHVIFAAATLAENLPTKQAVGRVVNYANALMSIDGAQKRSLASDPIPPQWKIKGVKPLENGVKIKYANGPYLDVELFSWSIGAGKELGLSPIFGDPRLPLDPVSPRDGSSDPIEKTALFISPFDGDRQTVTWYDYQFVNRRTNTPGEMVHGGLGIALEIGEMTRRLEGRGYRVKTLRDAEANIINLIEALIPGKDGRSHSPGFVGIMTHGLSDGNLLTGTILGTDDDWQESFRNIAATLKAHGYGDLLTYGGGTEESPATIEATVLTRTMRPGPLEGDALVYSLCITPKFWEWLKTRQADFSRSLVFVSACLTDINPDLRNAISARAYFAFDIPVYVGFAAKALQYFCYTLVRPTRSAEEAYYNLIRVANTKQMIYTDDILLTQLPDNIRAQGDSAMYFFRGYGFDGQKMVPYMSGGWMSTVNADPGAIWWLLFGGRWGQNAKDGSDGMVSCWNSLWKDGKTGGLGNQICHNKSPGRAPTQAEVSYATYLLTGKPALGTQGITLIPRWTLNDGR